MKFWIGRQMSYPGGLNWLRKRAARRKMPFVGLQGEMLDHFDFESLKDARVEHRPAPKNLPLAHILRKVDDLSFKFQDDCALCYHHALTIAILRHEDPPEHAIELFHKMWETLGEYLIGTLEHRWLISAMITFGDYGKQPIKG